jgi:Ca2+-binding EF-hand superfamily protein
VVESAFKLFDRDKSGYIDFREFCCGLSIICLSGTNEKIRFVFDLFDLDRDGYLNRTELRTLLETSVMSFRKFSTGPGE